MDIQIYREYRGETKNYHVMMNGEEVFRSKDSYQADMFIAELKASAGVSRVLDLAEMTRVLKTVFDLLEEHTPPWYKMDLYYDIKKVLREE